MINKSTKQELKYLAIAVVFSFVVIGYIIPYLLDGGANNMNPFLQFLIFNVAIFVFLQIFSKAIITNSKIKIRESIGVLLLFISLDIIAPPLMISTTGQFLTGPTLSGSASDYIAGLLWNSIGIQGFFLYLAVYVLTPFILLFLASKLLKNMVHFI